MATAYPDPLVFPPLQLPHKQTFILLHGRGSWGDKFGRALLDSPIPYGSETRTLAACFPHARFVFPTAARRRATVYKRSLTHQWFDSWKLDPPARDREELQIPRLSETTLYLHEILCTEIAAVNGDASNVVLGGLSQGCAASLTSLLLWDGEPLAAWFGMCGWLPFAASLIDICDPGASEKRDNGQAADISDEFDPFERVDNDGDTDIVAASISWLREELQVLEINSTRKTAETSRTPLFLGHGVEDKKVSIVLGREAHRCVDKLGFDASWTEYESLGHWYSGEMLSDIVAFIVERTKWETSK